MENGGSGEEFPDDESDDGLDDDSSLSDWNLRKVSIMFSLCELYLAFYMEFVMVLKCALCKSMFI